MIIKCNSKKCIYNNNGTCTSEIIEINEYDLGVTTNSCDTFRGESIETDLQF